MLQEIYAASQALNEALDRYISVCSSIQTCCSHGTSPSHIPNLSESLAKEMSLTSIYHEKLSKAELSMRQIHNSPMIVPVNRLPLEILTSIFQMVQIQDMRPCSLERTDPYKFGTPNPMCPKYPDILSHVCMRWRQIAIASNHLWAHIDIALSCSLTPKLLSRAQIFVTRAGQAPLHLHILDPGTHLRYQVPSSDSDSERPSNGSSDGLDALDDPRDDLESDWETYNVNGNESDYTNELDISEDLGLIFPSPTAIKIIEFVAVCKPHKLHFSALRDCLVNCLPGTLKKIGVFCRGSTQQISSEEESKSSGLVLKLPKAQLESILSSVSVLHAGGMHPCWTSTAYHGLTTLRLTGGIMSIPESNLVGILRSNPGLRIIELGVKIERSIPIGSSVTPFHLDSLRHLDVTSMEEDGFDTFFRWISPISTPLQLVLGVWPHSSALMTFCGLSKVTELYFDHSDRSMYDDSTSLQKILSLSTHLRVLVVEFNADFWRLRMGPDNQDDQVNCSSGPSSLDALYLLNCRHITLDDLKKAIEKHSIQKIVLQACSIKKTKSYEADDNMLRTLCPVVEIRSMSDPYPTMLEPVAEFA